MSLPGMIGAARAQEEPAALVRKGMRVALTGVGLLIMLAGVIAFILFLHTLGIILFAIGLVFVLRHSFSARRTFIKAQRRHPKIVFPIRRLLRREPEVIPVLWQQTLRLEALVLPVRWRFLSRSRLSMKRKRKPI